MRKGAHHIGERIDEANTEQMGFSCWNVGRHKMNQNQPHNNE